MLISVTKKHLIEVLKKMVMFLKNIAKNQEEI